MSGRVTEAVVAVGAELRAIRRRLVEGLWLPRRSEETIFTVVVGALFWYLNFLFVPAFFVLGFMTRLLDGTASNAEPDRTYPDFDRWPALFVDGARAFGIWFTYLTLPWTIIQGGATVGEETTTIGFLGLVVPNPPNIILVGLSRFLPADQLTTTLAGVLGEDIADPTTQIPFLERVIVSVGDPLGIGLVDPGAYTTVEFYVLMLVVLYITPAALANFATANRRLADGFDFPVLRPVLFDWRYFLNWCVVVVILVGGSALIRTWALPLSGLYFYLWGVAYYVVGDVWREVEPQTVAKRLGRLERRVERLQRRLRSARQRSGRPERDDDR